MFSRIVFFNDTATTEIYTLSLHDALPIFRRRLRQRAAALGRPGQPGRVHGPAEARRRLHGQDRKHTSELQSRQYLVCRLLLEKKQTSLYSSSSSHTYTYC